MTAALQRYAAFGAALAFAGPPIYIHAPNLYAAEYGLGLAAVGTLLLGLRALDFVQDPALGWWLGRTRFSRGTVAAGFALMLGLGALLLFWPSDLATPGVRLAIGLAVVFTGFSALQILFYETGLALAQAPGASHNRVAGWREAGVLLGVTAACILPEALTPAFGRTGAYGVFALIFCAGLALGLVAMARVWPRRDDAPERPNLRLAWRDAGIRRLLAIGLLNALPTGVTATLFLFFVQDRLEAPGHAGPALVCFFLAAAAAAPAWARAAKTFGQKRALLAAMTGAIAIFALALTLGAGDWPAFYLIAIGSGAAMGADMTLLPAMLSARTVAAGVGGAAVFGLWGFVNKASLALAAGLVLPALDFAGYEPSGANGPEALAALTLAYAGAPLALKALALVALARTPDPEKEAA